MNGNFEQWAFDHKPQCMLYKFTILGCYKIEVNLYNTTVTNELFSRFKIMSKNDMKKAVKLDMQTGPKRN